MPQSTEAWPATLIVGPPAVHLQLDVSLQDSIGIRQELANFCMMEMCLHGCKGGDPSSHRSFFLVTQHVQSLKMTVTVVRRKGP